MIGTLGDGETNGPEDDNGEYREKVHCIEAHHAPFDRRAAPPFENSERLVPDLHQKAQGLARCFSGAVR